MKQSLNQHPVSALAEQAGRLPNFVIIGATKAGTTTLFEYLRRHPDVFMPQRKEVFYFSKEEVYAKGIDWYRSLFAGARDDQMCGEATPSYSVFPRYPQAAPRLAAVMPHAKLIYIMRHPVERAWSHYIMAQGTELPYADESPDHRAYVDPSRYARQIKRYLEFFPREQLLLLRFEQLKADPARLCERMQQFIGVRVTDLVDQGPVQANIKGEFRVRRFGSKMVQRAGSTSIVSRLKHLMPADWRQGLRQYMAQGFPRSAVGRWMGRRMNQKMPELTEDVRARLRSLLEEDTKELEQLMGWDLSNWRR